MIRTVHDLIEALKTCDPDSEIFIAIDDSDGYEITNIEEGYATFLVSAKEGNN